MNSPDPETPTTAPDHVQRIGGRMLFAFWLVALVFMTWVAGRWLERQQNPNSAPQVREQNGVRELVLERNRYGHYVTSGEINGQPVLLLLDTGASAVAVPDDMADELGLERLAPVEVSTANGIAEAWLTRINEIRIGPLVFTEVSATLNPGMNHDDSVLLGMSALKHVEFTQKSGLLILRY